MPRVSEIVPAYNSELTLGQAIASIQAQSYADWLSCGWTAWPRLGASWSCSGTTRTSAEAKSAGLDLEPCVLTAADNDRRCGRSATGAHGPLASRQEAAGAATQHPILSYPASSAPVLPRTPSRRRPE